MFSRWLDFLGSKSDASRKDSRIPSFKRNESFRSVARKTMRCLVDDGWTPLELAPWANVWIRAKKNNVVANIVIRDRGAGWYTLVRDATEAAALLKGVVGVITFDTISAKEKEGHKRDGVYIIDPLDLLNLEKFIRMEMLRKDTAQRKALGKPASLPLETIDLNNDQALVFEPSMTALVLNLDKDHDRLSKISNLLKSESDFKLVRISGVAGDDLSISERRAFAANERWSMKAGEIGCFLSHAKAWEYAAACNQPFCLILEDDAIPVNLARLKTAVLPANFDLIFVNDRMSGGSRKDGADSPLSFFPVMESAIWRIDKPKGVGGDGYLLSPRGAQKLLTAVSRDLYFGHVDWRLLRYCVKEDDLKDGAAEDYVTSVVRNHHNPHLSPAWGILNGFCSSTPLVHYGYPGSSARERTTASVASKSMTTPITR